MRRYEKYIRASVENENNSIELFPVSHNYKVMMMINFNLKFRSKLSYHVVRTFNAGKINLNQLFQLIILFSNRF